MKTGNVGIRNIADIGIGDIDAYNVEQKKYSKTEKVKLRIGVFFDGTGNNKFNSDNVYYNPKYSKLPLDEIEVKKSKNKFKSFIVESGSSYWNSYSNIALLHDLYEEKKDWKKEKDVEFQNLQLRFYIQGIGTEKDQKDTSISRLIGSGLGEGETGVISRVEEACERIADEIESSFKDRIETNKKPIEIISIQFDVFGFSRGAAAARHFCNEVLKSGKDKNPGIGEYAPIMHIKRPIIKKIEKTKDSLPSVKEYKTDAYKIKKDNIRVVQQINAPDKDIFLGGKLGDFLRKKKINYPKYNVSVEFLGIFDTVISQMLERQGIIDFARNPIKNTFLSTINPVLGMLTDKVASIKKVNPDLSNPNIKKILHLTAQTEWRDNFPITTIGNFNGTHAREISVLGSHSDIGGGYWQTKEELHTLHFFDLEKDTTAEEQKKLEQQKELLRNWYISKSLCENDHNKLYWETMHHVLSSEGFGSIPIVDNELKPESFMGDLTEKIEGNKIYTLRGYHHRLISKRPLNNKLSLVYLNVMKYIALNYANVPFLDYLDEKLNIIHKEEYQYPISYNIGDNDVYELKNEHALKPQNKDGKNTDLEKYQNLIIKVAEHGWTNNKKEKITYPKLINDDHKYYISPDIHRYIMGKFVHLSANFDDPLINMLEHYNFAYTNAPHFKNEKEFNDQTGSPYERQPYDPAINNFDKW